jgi:nicotinamide-nucleotide amidase
MPTGGLGPTCDDRTREAVAGVLGQKLVFDPAIEKHIARPIRPLRAQDDAEQPEAGLPIRAGRGASQRNGTAPGPLGGAGRQGAVHDARARRTSCSRCSPSRCFPGWRASASSATARPTCSCGRRGRRIAARDEAPAHLRPPRPGLGVAFCAHSGHVDCRLSSPGGELSPAELEAIAAECAQLLGEDFVTYGTTRSPRSAPTSLRAQEKRLAVAETATGGLLQRVHGHLRRLEVLLRRLRVLLERFEDAAARRARMPPLSSTAP